MERGQKQAGDMRKYCLIAGAILYVVVAILPHLLPLENPVLQFFEQPLLILAPTLLVAVLFLRRTQGSARDLFRLRGVSAPNLLWIALIVFLLPFVVNFIADVTIQVIPDQSSSDALIVPDDGKGLLWAVGAFLYGLVFMAVFPGICEEVLFRGVLMRFSQEAGWKLWLIVLSNAALFALFHQNLIQLPYTFVLGIVFALIVWLTDSLLAGIFAHIAYNFIIDVGAGIDLEAHPIAAAVADFYGMPGEPLLAFLAAAGIALILVKGIRRKAEIGQQSA